MEKLTKYFFGHYHDDGSRKKKSLYIFYFKYYNILMIHLYILKLNIRDWIKGAIKIAQHYLFVGHVW